jgi:hypothetical protein
LTSGSAKNFKLSDLPLITFDLENAVRLEAITQDRDELVKQRSELEGRIEALRAKRDEARAQLAANEAQEVTAEAQTQAEVSPQNTTPETPQEKIARLQGEIHALVQANLPKGVAIKSKAFLSSSVSLQQVLQSSYGNTGVVLKLLTDQNEAMMPISVPGSSSDEGELLLAPGSTIVPIRSEIVEGKLIIVARVIASNSKDPISPVALPMFVQGVETNEVVPEFHMLNDEVVQEEAARLQQNGALAVSAQSVAPATQSEPAHQITIDIQDVIRGQEAATPHAQEPAPANPTPAPAVGGAPAALLDQQAPSAFASKGSPAVDPHPVEGEGSREVVDRAIVASAALV